MLGFVADLDRSGCGRRRQRRHTLSPAGLYQKMLDRLDAHEKTGVGGGPGGTPGLGHGSCGTRSPRSRCALWEADKTRCARTARRGRRNADRARAEPLSRQQTVHAIGCGSLLVRSEEGLFGFIHPLGDGMARGQAIAAELTSGETRLLCWSAPLRQLAVEFLCDLAEHGACRMGRRRLARATTGAANRRQRSAVLTRLRVPATPTCAGALLPGEDLSYRDFAEVDLTGADLTDAPLVGATCPVPSLRDARLTGARLDGAADRRRPARRRPAGAPGSSAPTSPARSYRQPLARAALIDARGVPDTPELARRRRARQAVGTGSPPPRSASARLQRRAGSTPPGPRLQPRRRNCWRRQRGRRRARLRHRDRPAAAHPAGPHRPGLRGRFHGRSPRHRAQRRHRAAVGPGDRAGAPRLVRAQRVGVAGRAGSGAGRRGHRGRGGHRAAVGTSPPAPCATG